LRLPNLSAIPPFGFCRSRKAIDWTARLPAIAEGARRLKAKSFTLNGEAVVIGPNGLTDFEALRRRGSGDVAVL
jgi:ATP-dependent DNA ligase